MSPSGAIPTRKVNLSWHRRSPHGALSSFFSGVLINSRLYQAANGITASYDALVDLFECVANFLNRLHIYTEIPFDSIMAGIIVKILVEVLSILALATKQIKQGRLSEKHVPYVSILT
jgi:hypothetical protein